MRGEPLALKASTTVNDARSATRRLAILALLVASGACNSAPHYYQQTDATPRTLAPRHVDETAPQSSQHDPFEALIDDESSDAFEARAHRALTKLDEDRHRAKSRGCPDHAYAEVGDALHRARTRLAAIAEGHYDAVDDGRLHVAVAINTARRRLDDIAPTLVSVR